VPRKPLATTREVEYDLNDSGMALQMHSDGACHLGIGDGDLHRMHPGVVCSSHSWGGARFDPIWLQ
jgi:hypothetical protein